MKVFIREREIEIEQPTAEKIIEVMNEHLDAQNFFSHFIVDGVEIHEEHEQYLNEFASTIQKLEVITKTVEEFINAILLSAEKYIEQSTVDIEGLINEFYQTPTTKTWEKFSHFLEGTEWLTQMIMTVGNTEKPPKNYSAYIEILQSIQDELKALEEAMQNKDNVLVGDLIQYEITPLFENLQVEITKTIDEEGTRDNVN